MSREGRGWCEADGLASLAGGRTVAAAVTDARGMTKRGFARLPGRGDAGRTELAERLLASQRTFAGAFRARPRHCPRHGRHRRPQERRRDQAGLTFPAGRARLLR
ncbi:MAG TPA: hypothetical protein VNO54_12400 [Streptosporangiaceae bacterium]|nr:hypothetical protein [Streptosporangiaceae bacterium]